MQDNHFKKLTITHNEDSKSCRVFVLKMLLSFCTLTTASCASKLVIQSEPSQVDLFVSVNGQNQKVSLGQTPLEITEPQLAEKLNLSPDSTQWVEFTFEKKDFEKKTVYLPSSRFGELTRIFKINLSPMSDPSTIVVKMMRHFFNAKKFAETRQFERAHEEVDKVIELDSQIPQAYAMKGGIYFLQGSMEQSVIQYKKALELDPSFDEAIKMLDRIKTKAGGS